MIVFGLACEDDGHHLTIARLVDDVLVWRIAWIERETVEHVRSWRGHDDGRPWSKAGRDDDAPAAFYVDGRRVPLHGHIDGQPLKAGARMWREVLLRFARLDPRPDVVVLAQDGDGRREERLEGLDQVRHGLRWPFPIVAAVPEPEIEGWQVAGFEPLDAEEARALAALCSELSFDPRMHSERLTSRPNDAPTDAKRVLARLCRGDAARESVCLDDVDRLRARGLGNGCADFLAEVETKVPPLFLRWR